MKFYGIFTSSFFIFLLFFLSAPLMADTRVKFVHDSTLRSRNEELKKVKAGETLVFNSKQPLLIESQGRLPVLLVPLESQEAEVEVNSPLVKEWPTKEVRAFTEKTLNEVLGRTFAIQRLLQQKRAEEALRIVDTTLAAYPSAKHLNFLKASALVLLGKRSEARESLDLALEVDPQNPEGRELKTALGGSAP